MKLKILVVLFVAVAADHFLNHGMATHQLFSFIYGLCVDIRQWGAGLSAPLNLH